MVNTAPNRKAKKQLKQDLINNDKFPDEMIDSVASYYERQAKGLAQVPYKEGK